MSLQPGTIVGPYSVNAKIGEGGMGEVYRARDTKLDRDVALKVLPQAFTDDPDRLARFEREAKVLASLNHPNIGHIYGLEEAEDTKALVLELIEGPTLADRIKQGPIPVDEALPIAKQIAEALEAAHEQGIIHRDLKPANIKLKPDGTVKVLDFGLAKAFQPEASDVSASMSPTISLTAAATQMGMVVGTAAYMAPEQAKGKVVDKRADIWAFGAVLYEMLTGQRTFAGGDVSDTLAYVLTKEINWTTLPADTPDSVRQLLRRCLDRDPHQRLRDIGEARIGIQGSGDASVAPSPGTPVKDLRVWQRPGAVLAAIVTGVLVSGLGVWSLTRPGPQEVSRFEIPLRPEETVTGAGRHVLAVSPNGRQIVYTTTQGLALRSLGQLTSVLVAGTDGGTREPFFSADGQSIGFYTEGQLRKVFTSGGAPVTLGDATNPWGASWGTDDMILFGQGPDGIWRVSGTGGTPEQIIAVDAGEQAHGPQMLPDQWVLFTLWPVGATSWDESQIVMHSLATGERVVLIEGGRDARYVETGHLVYALNGVVTAIALDLDTRRVLGGPVPLVEGVQAAFSTGAAMFSVAKNGSLVYVPGGGEADTFLSTLVMVDRTGNAVPFTDEARDFTRPRVSPDGTHVAVEVSDESGTHIWVMNIETGISTQLTFEGGANQFPIWTSDSQTVIYKSFGDDAFGFYQKSADGTGRRELILEGDDLQLPAVVRDGVLIFQEAGDGDDVNISTIQLGEDGSRSEFLATGAIEQSASVSPDGRWLSYSSDESGETQLYVRPYPQAEGGQRRISDAGGRAGVWSPDGAELYFWTPLEDNIRLMTVTVQADQNFTSGRPQELFAVRGRFQIGPDSSMTPKYDITPDGEQFVFVQPAAQADTTRAFSTINIVLNWFEELKERVPVP